MGQEFERAALLLENLYRSGGISEKSAQALLAAGNASEQIARGLGRAPFASELLIAGLLVDDSPSVSPYVREIQRGHTRMLAALAGARSTCDVLVHTRLFNRGVLSAYQPVEDAVALDVASYNASRLLGATPLYLQSLLTLGTAVAKAHEEESRGAGVRTFTLIITDGEDNASGEVTADSVRTLVRDMLEFSTNHIVAGMGVGEGAGFRAIFRSMGIPPEWIFTPGSTPADLEAVFRRIGKALELAASSRTGFLGLAAGPGD